MILFFILVILIIAFLVIYYLWDKDSNLNKHHLFEILYNDMIKDSGIDKIIKLDKDFFSEDLLWDARYQKRLFHINKDTIVLIKYKGEVIGYINYLVITKKKYNQIKKANSPLENYKPEDIRKFSKDTDNYITINSVVVKKEFQNSKVIKVLAYKMKHELREKDNNGYKISGINSTAVSKDGKKFLKKCGFKYYKTLKKDYILFICEDKDLKNYLKKSK